MMHSKSTEALLKKMIPGKAHRRVFEVMLHSPPKRPWSMSWRTIDLQRETGHNSDENRLRELRRMYPKLFITEHATYAGRGGSHNEYRIRANWLKILRGYERGTL
jgi:hypothetical protein